MKDFKLEHILDCHLEIEWRIISLEQIWMLREPLEKLHQHHNSVSRYFPGSYPRITFEERVEEYKRNAEWGEYRIELLKEVEAENIIGYCIAYSRKISGKIEVLFVDEEHRGKGIGEKLVRNSMKWFESKGIEELELTVVYGNEAASFYQKLGFYPRSIIMTTRKDHNEL